jgi:hypothetical protein
VPDESRLSALVPDYLAQIALYSGLLSRLFPARPVRCGLLWTVTPRLDWIAPEELEKAASGLGLSTGWAGR